MPAPKEPSVSVDRRDFAPAWHLRAVAVSAAALLLCLLACWKVFL